MAPNGFGLRSEHVHPQRIQTHLALVNHRHDGSVWPLFPDHMEMLALASTLFRKRCVLCVLIVLRRDCSSHSIRPPPPSSRTFRGGGRGTRTHKPFRTTVFKSAVLYASKCRAVQRRTL